MHSAMLLSLNYRRSKLVVFFSTLACPRYPNGPVCSMRWQATMPSESVLATYAQQHSFLITFPAQTLWLIPILTCLRHFPLSPLSLPHLLALWIPLAHPHTHPIQNTAPLSLEISTALKTHYWIAGTPRHKS